MYLNGRRWVSQKPMLDMLHLRSLATYSKETKIETFFFTISILMFQLLNYEPARSTLPHY